jgi:hypothetical protein
MESTIGLSRALSAGESVILSSGSTATVRKSYPAGYDGDVEILLDGAEERELARNLTLVDEEPSDPGPALGDAVAAQREMGEARAPSREMKN